MAETAASIDVIKNGVDSTGRQCDNWLRLVVPSNSLLVADAAWLFFGRFWVFRPVTLPWYGLKPGTRHTACEYDGLHEIVFSGLGV